MLSLADGSLSILLLTTLRPPLTFTPVRTHSFTPIGGSAYAPAGKTAISWDVKPSAQLTLVTTSPFSSTTYYSFEFWIYGGGYSGQQITVTMLLNDGTPTLPVNIASVLTGGVQPWLWSRVVVPFSHFGISTSIPYAILHFIGI